MGFPILFFVICLFLVVLPIIQRPIELGVAIGVIIIGIPVYYFAIYREDKPKWFIRFTGECSTVSFLFFLFILVSLFFLLCLCSFYNFFILLSFVLSPFFYIFLIPSVPWLFFKNFLCCFSLFLFLPIPSVLWLCPPSVTKMRFCPNHFLPV